MSLLAKNEEVQQGSIFEPNVFIRDLSMEVDRSLFSIPVVIISKECRVLSGVQPQSQFVTYLQQEHFQCNYFQGIQRTPRALSADLFFPYFYQENSRCHYFQRMQSYFQCSILGTGLFLIFIKELPEIIIFNKCRDSSGIYIGPCLFLNFIKDVPDVLISKEFRAHSELYLWNKCVYYIHQGNSRCYYIQRIQRSLSALSH